MTQNTFDLFSYYFKESSSRVNLEQRFKYPNSDIKNILQLDDESIANYESLRQQYRKLALVYHPDKFADRTDNIKADFVFKKISEAYDRNLLNLKLDELINRSEILREAYLSNVQKGL